MAVLFAATARRSEMSGLPADDPSLTVLPPATTAEVLRLARGAEFTRLTRLFDAARGRLARDPEAEFELAQLVAAFAVVDNRLDAPLDRWVADAPTSYAARLARAAHHLARLEAQSVQSGTSTGLHAADPAGTAASPAAGVAAVLEDVRSALAVDRRLTTAYVQAIDAHALAAPAEPQLCREMATRGLEQAPLSASIRTALVRCLLVSAPGPLSDGTRHAEHPGQDDRDLDREIAAWAARPPAMPALTALIAWDRGRRAVGDPAIASFSRAIAAGPHWWIYRDRADAYLMRHQPAEALADAGLGLTLMPEQPDLLMLRVEALRGLGRLAEARSARQHVEAIDPMNVRLTRLIAREQARAVADARAALAAGTDAASVLSRTDAASVVKADAASVVHTINRVLDEWPANAELLYWRGRAHLALDEPDQALGDFEHAVSLDGSHRAASAAIVQLLAGRGDWPGIALRWTAYLNYVPADGEAWAQRATAQRHIGDLAAAALDASQACALGVSDACPSH